MAFNNLFNSGYFGSSPPAGGGGCYRSAYSSPYGPQSQQSPGASAVTPTTTSSPYNSQDQPEAMGPSTTPTRGGLGNISSSAVQPGREVSAHRYHPAIVSPYNLPNHQDQTVIMAPPIAPTKLASPYNVPSNQGQSGLMDSSITPTKLGALNNLPIHQGQSGGYGVSAGDISPYYNHRSQSMIGPSPVVQATMNSPSPTKSSGRSKLETDPSASIPNDPYSLGRTRFSLPLLVGQSTGISTSMGYMDEESTSAAMTIHHPMSSSYAAYETSTPAAMTTDPSGYLQFSEAVAPSNLPNAMEFSREIKTEASKTEPSMGFGWIEIETSQASAPIDHGPSSIDPTMPGNTQNIPAVASIAPANPYYVAPQPTAPAPTRARRQVPITSEALAEAYHAINYLTRIGDIQKKDCDTYGTLVEIPAWLSSADFFKAALVFPFDHSFHGTGAGGFVDPKDIELGIWENFEDKLDKYYTLHCRCFFRYDDPFQITSKRDPFKKRRAVLPPENCAFCTLEAHLGKARKYVDSLNSSAHIPDTSLFLSAVDPNLLSQAGQSQAAPSHAGPSQNGPSHVGFPSQAVTPQAGYPSQAEPSQAEHLPQALTLPAGASHAESSHAGQIEPTQCSGNKREMWYWIETSKVNAFLNGFFPLTEAEELATDWKEASGSMAKLDDMTNTLLNAVDEMWFHLYMGILVPLCHKWCYHPEFKRCSTGNAKSRRQFWRLRMISEPDCVQEWLECLDVLIDPKAFAKKVQTDTPWDIKIRSSLKMWTERVFLMSMDLVFVEIVVHTYVKGYHPDFVKNTQDLDLGHYGILKSRSWKFDDLLKDPDVKQFEVAIDNWYMHTLTPATGLAAHVKASQLISASCIAGRPSSQRAFVGGTTDGHTETGYWFNDGAGLNLDVFHQDDIL